MSKTETFFGRILHCTCRIFDSNCFICELEIVTLADWGLVRLSDPVWHKWWLSMYTCQWLVHFWSTGHSVHKHVHVVGTQCSNNDQQLLQTTCNCLGLSGVVMLHNPFGVRCWNWRIRGPAPLASSISGSGHRTRVQGTPIWIALTCLHRRDRH